MINWQEMFKKYTGIVGEAEGVWFLYEQDWTDEEWTALKKLLGDL